MLRIVDLTGSVPSQSHLRRVLPRGRTDVAAVLGTVSPIVEAVRVQGARAALDYGEQFDGVRPPSIRVPEAVIDRATASLDPVVRAAMEVAIARVRAVHADQKPAPHTTTLADGATVTEVFLPIARAGLYVPGGKAVYPSSVIMNVVPAQEAGVEEVVVASPPQDDGWPHPTILAACRLLGVAEVWAVGGAQAVALLAYGDDGAGLAPVDIITGPGNIFVTAAKRAVQGVVGTDAEAGPSEIAIVADDSADPVYLAYDLISQAEHDPMAASVLITDSRELALRVDEEIEARYRVTLNAERVAEALRGEQSGTVIVDDIPTALLVADAYASEHLEVITRNSRADAEKIKNAGAIFIGPYAPVPLGDYAAGSNHVLPTSGTARFSAGLTTHTFLRPVNLIDYDKEALREISADIIALADAEQLPAHGEAIRARFEETVDGDR